MNSLRDVILIACIAPCFALLFCSLVCNVLIVSHRQHGTSVFDSLMGTTILFCPDAYTTRGRRIRRWYIACIIAFMPAGLIGVALFEFITQHLLDLK